MKNSVVAAAWPSGMGRVRNGRSTRPLMFFDLPGIHTLCHLRPAETLSLGVQLGSQAEGRPADGSRPEAGS